MVNDIDIVDNIVLLFWADVEVSIIFYFTASAWPDRWRCCRRDAYVFLVPCIIVAFSLLSRLVISSFFLAIELSV